MNHEYVLFSKNTCQNSMVNVLDKDKILWYVMRAYKNENTAEDRLSNETYGLEYFIPKQKVLRTVKGKKVFFMVPVIHSLVFVHASHQKIVDFKHNYYYDLQFVTWNSGNPAKFIKKRFSDEKIEFLLKLEWWNWSGEEIFDNLEILTSEAGLEELMNKYSKRDAIN